MSDESESVKVHEVRCEIRIEAPREKVWESLTRDIGSWWHPGFMVGGEEARMTLDARVGGSMKEVRDGGEEGEGVEWARVVGVRRNEMLLLVGELFAAWGGPSHLQQSYTLAADGDGTVLTLSEMHVGRLSERALASMHDGWRFLLAGRLKPRCEGRALSEWDG